MLLQHVVSGYVYALHGCAQSRMLQQVTGSEEDELERAAVAGVGQSLRWLEGCVLVGITAVV